MENFPEIWEKEQEIEASFVVLYIKEYQLRITYHLDSDYDSYWVDSDYYNNNEVIDTDDVGSFLQLDYRERDFKETLQEKGYFLIGEKDEKMPDYIDVFLESFSDDIHDTKIKEIKRTNSKKKLQFIQLYVDKNILDTIARKSKEIHSILNRIMY